MEDNGVGEDIIWHLKVNKGKAPDPYAQPNPKGLNVNRACGCPPAPCGFVIARNDCEIHGLRPKIRIRQGHMARNCPCKKEDK